MKVSGFVLFFLLFSLVISRQNIYASGNIEGVITDSLTTEPLFGANVILIGTTFGSSSDMLGNYSVKNIPDGKYTVRFSYIGYKKIEIKVEIKDGVTLKIDAALSPDIFEGDEVVITALAMGQAAAINEQLGSNTIVNVVSKDKLKELPDANAAESIGRLPGISIERDAGEGTKVIVRGLSPKYNSITVNGERIPATDPENRSVDLSMISSDMLEGIEVFKALTPDKDGDAVGGTVNFVVKQATKGLKGNVRLNGGYNDHENDYANYTGSFSLSDRLFNEKLGVLITGNLQRANRSSDVLDAAYDLVREKLPNEDMAPLAVRNLNLGDRKEIRDRYGASISLDYNIPNGNLMFSSLFGRTERDEVRMRKRYRVEASYVEYWLRAREINTDLYSNTFSGKYDFPFMTVDMRTSYSVSNREMPKSHDSQFREIGAFTSDLIEDKGPQYIPDGAKNNLDETTFYQDFLDTEKIDDRDFTAQIDFKIPLLLNNDLNIELKLGGKYRDKYRERDKTQYSTLAFVIDKIGAANPDLFDLTRENKIQISNFIDYDFENDKFLNDDYSFPIWLDQNKLEDFKEDFNSSYTRNGAFDLEDYEAGERITAVYLMSEIKFGDLIMFLPGFRYENTVNDYSNIWGNSILNDDGSVTLVGAKDTTGTRSYDVILPMLHLKIKPTDWFDIRLAITKSLSRPDYFNLVPWERITSSESLIERGNSDLKHTSVWNYDAFLSFNNNFGLVTVGAFYKNLKNIDYLRTSRITLKNRGYNLIQPFNSDSDTKVYGFEIDVQANLRFLPEPFDGFVISANYSHIKSETFFPLLKVEHQTEPPFATLYINAERKSTLPGQADDIFNISLGYEKGKFTGRISMIYQGAALQTIGSRSELDGYTDAFTRWDLTARYKILENLSLIANINNLTNKSEGAFLGSELFPTSEEYFGLTADLGVIYKF